MNLFEGFVGDGKMNGSFSLLVSVCVVTSLLGGLPLLPLFSGFGDVVSGEDLLVGGEGEVGGEEGGWRGAIDEQRERVGEGEGEGEGQREGEGEGVEGFLCTSKHF